MNIIVAVLNLIYVIAVSFAIWKLNERIKNQHFYTADVEKMIERRLGWYGDEVKDRLSYLEWRVSHPEIEFAPINEEQIAFDAKFASGKIVKDIISDTTGDVLKVKVFFNSGDNRQLEDAMNLKALLEKYGTQLFK